MNDLLRTMKLSSCKLPTLFILIATLLIGCGPEDDRFIEKLDEIEQSYIEASDSTIHLLDSMGLLLEGKPEALKMRYYLILAETRNQASLPLLDDSLMHSVAHYYQESGTPLQRARSLYQLGYIYAQMGEAPAALQQYNNALEEDIDTSSLYNCRLLHLIHSQKAALLCNQNMPLAQLEEERLAHHFALLYGDTIMALRHDCFSAWAYELLGKTDSTIAILERTHRQFLHLRDTVSAAQLRGLEMHLFIDNGQLAKAKECMEEYELKSGYFDGSQRELPDFSIYHYNKGRYYLAVGDYRLAEQQFRSSLVASDDKEPGYRGLTLLYKQTGNTDSLAKYAELCYLQSDSNILRSTASELQRMQSLYNYSRNREKARQSEVRLERQRIKTHFILIISVAVFLLSLLSFYFYHRRRNEHQKHLEEKYRQETRQLEMMKKDLVKYQQQKLDEMAKDKATEIELLKEKIALDYPVLYLGELDRTLHESDIYKHLMHKAADAKQTIDAQDMMEVYALFENTIPAFFEQLAVSGYVLKEDEKQICSLIRLGLPTYSIIQLLSLKPSNYSLKRSRLNAKIFKSGGNGKDFDSKIRKIH